MKYIDTLANLARDAVILKLNLKEVLDPDQDWDMVFDKDLDNKFSTALSEAMISGHLTYGDCLLTIESFMFKNKFNHDEKYMRKIDCLNKLSKPILMFLKNRLPVYWFHYLVLCRLDRWKPFHHSWQVQSLMDTCSPILHPKMIELRNECANWEYLATMNGLFE